MHIIFPKKKTTDKEVSSLNNKQLTLLQENEQEIHQFTTVHITNIDNRTINQKLIHSAYIKGLRQKLYACLIRIRRIISFSETALGGRTTNKQL